MIKLTLSLKGEGSLVRPAWAITRRWKSSGESGGANSEPEATASSRGEVGRKPEAKLCTEEHEPRIRLGDLGELARDGKARHHQQGRQVNAAGVEGK
jgi:hypothetical protein